MCADVRTRRPWLNPLFSTGDIVQDVCRNVLSDLDGFRENSERAFVSYLSTVVRSRLVDTIRFHEAVRRDRRRVVGSPEELELVTPSRGPATTALDRDAIDKFRIALASFTQHEQSLLRLRLENELTFEELAEKLSYNNADTARKAFYGLQAKLLLRLRQAGVTPGVTR